MKLLPLARTALTAAGIYSALSYSWGLDALQAGALSIALSAVPAYAGVALLFARRKARSRPRIKYGGSGMEDTPSLRRQGLPAIRPVARPVPPPKPRNAMVRADKRLHDTVATAWAIAAQKVEQKAPGTCQAIVSTTGEFGLYVVRWKMELVQPPTREIVRLIEKELVLNLRYILNDEEVSTLMHGRQVHIELPSPLPKPDTHISNMHKYMRAGVDVQATNEQHDVSALVGVDNDRRIVRVELSQYPVILYIGAPNSGKTASLKGLLMSIILANEPERVQLYILANKPRDWVEFEGLPHVAQVALTPPERLQAVQEIRKRMAKADSRESGGRTNHPTVIMVLDDQSSIVESDEWSAIKSDINAIVLEGRQKRFYTIVTTHRWTVESGIGSRALLTASQMRVAFATGGEYAEYNKILGTNIKGTKLPNRQGEALVSQYGELQHHITTVYVQNGELSNIISAYEKATNATNIETQNRDNLQGHASRMGGECNEVPGSEIQSTTGDFSRGDDGSTSYNGTTIYNGSTAKPTAPLQGDTVGANGGAGSNGATKNARRTMPNVLRNKIIERDEHTCRYCFRVGSVKNDPDGQPWEVDHAIPVADDGTDDEENLELACRTCNRGKGAMTPLQFFDKRLNELDGAVPRLRKVGRAYLVTIWDCLRIWYAHEAGGKYAHTIAREAFESDNPGGNQSRKIEEYIELGRAQYERIRARHINQDTAPGGVDLGALLDEIERGLNDAQG